MKDIGWAKEDHLDVPLTSMRKDEDDPALQIPTSREVQGVYSKLNIENCGSKLDSMDSQNPHWRKVRTYVKMMGLFSSTSRDAKNFGTKLDGSKSFATHEVAVPEVKRTLYINPDGQFRSTWDIIQVFVLFYLAWITPYRVGFDAPAYGPEFWFETLVDLYFIVDVVLNFMTGFWKDMETTTVLVSDAKEIALKYLKTWFIVDVIACAPVDLATRAVEGQLACSFAVKGCSGSRTVNSNALKLFKLLRIFRLLKLLRLFRVSRLVQRYQNTLIYYHSFISIGRVNLLVILISHWVGCLFGIAHDWDDGTPKSKRWLLAVYWAVQSITSVGYGDIPAENSYSQTLSIFTMLIGVVLVSWIMTNVLAAMNPDSSARRFHERLHYVLAYLKNNQLPSGVAKRVITFYRWQNMNQFDEKSVLSDLPAQLRKDIFDNLYTHALQDMPIFSGCSTQFMTEVCLRMSPISFPQFQNVYCQGELGMNMYFITKGSVAVIFAEVIGQPTQEDLERMSDDCLELGRGSFFGEAAVLGYPSRLETIITTRSSTMMTLRLQDMNELCQLSFEFKAELMIIALERMRRSKVNPEVVGFALREFGLDPNEIIAESGEGEVEEVGEVGGRVTLGRLSDDVREQVKYVHHWKELVCERVGNSAVASVPKIFQSIKHVDKHISAIEDRLEALDGKQAARNPRFSRGESASSPEGPPGATVSARLDALETKMDLLLKLVSKKA